MAQDSSKADFWDTRYQNNVTPWDSAGLPSGFTVCAGKLLSDAPAARVLIPGCGTAYELAWLRQQGVDALAFDFSPLAVNRARAAFPACADHILEADFFGPAIDGAWHWVYERAFLCAMPREMWPRVVQRWAALLPPGALLLGYFFFDEQPKGPPFGAARAELEQLMSAHFSLEQEAAVPDSIPVFRGKERWMAWRRKKAL